MFLTFEGIIGEAAILVGAIELIDSERFPLEEFPISGYGLVVLGMAVFVLNGFWLYREMLLKNGHLLAAIRQLRAMDVTVEVSKSQVADLQSWFARGKVADFGTTHLSLHLNIVNHSEDDVWLDFKLVNIETDLPPVEVIASPIAEWKSSQKGEGQALMALRGSEIVKEARLQIPLRMTLQPAEMSFPLLGQASYFRATLKVYQGGKPESVVECPIVIGKEGVAFQEFKKSLFNWASTGETVEGRSGQAWVELLYRG